MMTVATGLPLLFGGIMPQHSLRYNPPMILLHPWGKDSSHDEQFASEAFDVDPKAPLVAVEIQDHLVRLTFLAAPRYRRIAGRIQVFCEEGSK